MSLLNYICHRRPDRSFFIKGHQFPVCARCTGFYISLVVYFIYAAFNFVNYDIFLLLIAILLLVPTGIDGFTQLIGLRESNNTLRFVTGLLGGLGLAILLKAFKWFLFLYFH